MANQTKGTTLRLYVRDDDLLTLKALTEAVELSQTEVMNKIMSAGLRALKEHGHRMPLPLRFEVVEEPIGDFRLNEEPPPKQKHRK